jgi:hypothetical protein
MEDKLNLKEGGIWIMDSIENDLKRIYDHYRKVVNENEYLRKENDRLKSEAYKDEELSKMKEKYDQMSKDYYRGFPISEKEEKKINEWIKQQMEKHPSGRSTIGGRFTYEFFPTSIGTAGSIIDGLTGDKFNFQELG